MKTDFDFCWEKSRYHVQGNSYLRDIAKSIWNDRGKLDISIAQRMNSPRVAGAIAALDMGLAGHTTTHEMVYAHDCPHYGPLNPPEVGQVHD